MEDGLIKGILQTGAAGAVIAVVWMFLRFLQEERADRMEERQGVWKVLNRLTEAIEKLEARLGSGSCPYSYDARRKE